jgi:hypothetical protein
MTALDSSEQRNIHPGDESKNVRLRTIGRSVAERVVREHPTLFLTLAYVGLTLVGLLYDVWFFFYFRINILDYSETGDFLLSAIRNPLVIILAFLPILILIGIQRLRVAARARSARYDAYAAKYDRSKWNSPGVRLAVYIFFTAVYAAAFTQLYAQRVANGIKAGHGKRITFVRNNGETSAELPILLGSTTKFFFLYYPSRKETEIVPVDNTAMLKYDSRLRRERRADSLAALRKK